MSIVQVNSRVVSSASDVAAACKGFSTIGLQFRPTEPPQSVTDSTNTVPVLQTFSTSPPLPHALISLLRRLGLLDCMGPRAPAAVVAMGAARIAAAGVPHGDARRIVAEAKRLTEQQDQRHPWGVGCHRRAAVVTRACDAAHGPRPRAGASPTGLGNGGARGGDGNAEGDLRQQQQQADGAPPDQARGGT
eukprot:gene13536-53312_t